MLSADIGRPKGEHMTKAMLLFGYPAFGLIPMIEVRSAAETLGFTDWRVLAPRGHLFPLSPYRQGNCTNGICRGSVTNWRPKKRNFFLLRALYLGRPLEGMPYSSSALSS